MKPPTQSHPSELLPWLVNGTLEGDERLEVEEHLRSCLVCRREVEQLRDLRREVRRTAPSPPAGGLERLLEEVGVRGARIPRSGRRRIQLRPWLPLLAAAAVAAVAVGVWLPRTGQGPQGPPAGERAGTEAAVLRSQVDPELPLPRRDFVLSWETEPAWREARFSVTVTTEALTLVAEAHGLEQTRYRVPPEALAAVPAGARLFWRLAAVRPDGARRTEIFPARLE